MRKLTKEEAAYIAGLVDGEGTISISKNKNNSPGSYSIVLRIYNSNIDMLNFVKEKTELGSVKPNQLTKKWEGRNFKQVFKWQIFANDMRTFLPQIIPYLISKKEIAKLVLEWLTRYGRKKLGGYYFTDEDREWRINTYLRLKKLNKRGLK